MEITMLHSSSKYILTTLLAAASLCASAQELNESMTVQGAYDPVIRKHERISPLPDRLSLPLPEASLPLATQGEPVDVDSKLAQQDAPSWGTRLPEQRRGYIDLLAGSFLNTSLSAGYRAISNSSTTLGIWLQHNSSSLFRANDDSPYRRRYDETVGARLSQKFAPGSLSLSAAYHLGYFNYYRAIDPAADPAPALPGSQTLNDFLFNAEWEGRHRKIGFNYHAGATYRYFGLRRIYDHAPEAFGSYVSHTPARENDVTVNATLGYNTTRVSTFSLALQGRWLPYSNSELSTPGFYSITPAYTLMRPHLRLRLGVRLDLSHSVEGYEKFATFHAAPDFSVSYTATRFTASLSATGGVQPNTLSSLHQLDYYSTPTLTATTPLYSPVNARLRLGFGNFRGFSAGLFATYAIMRNTPLAGTYPLYLFNLPGAAAMRLATPGYLDVRGFSMGADLRFALDNILTATGTLTYTPQHGSRGSFNGIDRPRWVLATEATVRPISPLSISVGYDYRGVRNLYFRTSPSAPVASLRLPDLYDLHARADYTFLSRYTVGISARNILSSNPWTTPDMPLEGFTLLGHFSVVF